LSIVSTSRWATFCSRQPSKVNNGLQIQITRSITSCGLSLRTSTKLQAIRLANSCSHATWSCKHESSRTRKPSRLSETKPPRLLQHAKTEAELLTHTMLGTLCYLSATQHPSGANFEPPWKVLSKSFRLDQTEPSNSPASIHWGRHYSPTTSIFPGRLGL
jgi:hypothetical protein